MPAPRKIESAQYVEVDAELNAEAERIAEEMIGEATDAQTLVQTLALIGYAVWEHTKQSMGVTVEAVRLNIKWVAIAVVGLAAVDVIAYAMAGGAITLGALALGLLIYPIMNFVTLTAMVAIGVFLYTFAIKPAAEYVWGKLKDAFDWLFSREPEAAPEAA